MKYWEVIKELTEDPTKKFEAKLSSTGGTLRMSVDSGIPRYFKFDVFYNKKLIVQSLNGGAFNGNLALDVDWQLVPQPVTWQEAIQAWADGKKISHSYLGYNNRFDFEDSNYMMSVDKIKEAEWYVED